MADYAPWSCESAISEEGAINAQRSFTKTSVWSFVRSFTCFWKQRHLGTQVARGLQKSHRLTERQAVEHIRAYLSPSPDLRAEPPKRLFSGPETPTAILQSPSLFDLIPLAILQRLQSLQFPRPLLILNKYTPFPSPCCHKTSLSPIKVGFKPMSSRSNVFRPSKCSCPKV